jgi:hypothetical protein
MAVRHRGAVKMLSNFGVHFPQWDEVATEREGLGSLMTHQIGPRENLLGGRAIFLLQEKAVAAVLRDHRGDFGNPNAELSS